MNYSDEELMAYVDGQLSAEEAKAIKAAVELDSDLQAKVNEFETTRQLLSHAFDEIIDEPIPQRLLDLLEVKPSVEPKSETAEVVSLAKHRETKSFFMRPMQQVATAASVALIIGGVVGHQFGSSQTSTLEHRLVQADAGFVVAGNPLHEALESTPSHEIHHVNTGVGDMIMPIMSFKAVDDRYCREFEINADSSISMGVACRIAGQWHVEVLLAAGQRAEGSLEYQPASGYSEDALNAVIDRMWNGEAFDAEQESQLISNRWQNN